MSDDQDNKNIDPTSMADEWSRISTNPDNLIVSDVLRSSLPDEFTEDENISSSIEITVQIGGLEVTAPMTRLDLTKTSWVCQASVDSSDAAVLLSYTIDELQEVVLEIKDKGNTIKELRADDSHEIVLGIDTDGQLYYVTLSCVKSLESN